jgi:membrane-bound serine protease (ClpP class)
MNPLLDPNVAYVLLVLGFMISVLALFSPGTGILEIGAIFALFLAGYSIANLAVNWWAFVIMILGIVPFVAALRFRGKQTGSILLGISALAFIGGSAFLFRNESGGPAVNIVLILLMSATSVGLTWFLARKMLEAVLSRPSFDLDRLVGMIGRASTDILEEGAVYVDGEEWSARSPIFIPAGSAVRVTGRTGLTLDVQPAPPEATTG